MAQDRNSDQKSCRIVAHRGGAGLRAENTVEAIRHSLGLRSPRGRKIDGIEVDVHLSADGVLVVHHDFALNPSIARFDGKWVEAPGSLVKDLSWADLQRYDVGRLKPGSSVAQRHPDCQGYDGVRIPALADVLDLVGDRCSVQIEVKRDAYNPEKSAGLERLVGALTNQLADYQDKVDFTVISFDWNVLQALQTHLSGVKCGYLTDLSYSRWQGADGDAPWAGAFHPSRFGDRIASAIAAAGGVTWGPNFRDLNLQDVEEAHSLGLNVEVWTVNEPDDMTRIQAMGVDVIATDRPDRALTVL